MEETKSNIQASRRLINTRTNTFMLEHVKSIPLQKMFSVYYTDVNPVKLKQLM